MRNTGLAALAFGVGFWALVLNTWDSRADATSAGHQRSGPSNRVRRWIRHFP